MRVERSSLEDVQAKFEEHKRKREEAAPVQPSAFAPLAGPVAPVCACLCAVCDCAGFETRVGWAEAEEEEQRRLRRERKLQKKARALRCIATHAATHPHAAFASCAEGGAREGLRGRGWGR